MVTLSDKAAFTAASPVHAAQSSQGQPGRSMGRSKAGRGRLAGVLSAINGLVEVAGMLAIAASLACIIHVFTW